MNILLVYPDAQQDYFEELRDTLENGFEDDEADVSVERSILRAEGKIKSRRRFDLVVCYVELPQKTGAVPDSEAALTLENFLRKNEINIPIVIIVPKLSSEIANRVSHPLSAVMPNNRSLGDSIIRFAKDRKAPEKQFDIVLNLSTMDDNSDWQYTIKGKNSSTPDNYSGNLKKLSSLILDNIVHFSEEVDNAQPEDWDKRVSRLCNNLKQYLIIENDEFRMDLQAALKQVGSLKQTRVQFVVDENVYPILLEAVMSPEVEQNINDKGDYWMEHAPLIRHVSTNRTGNTLFQEEERRPIDILIIGSNTSGPVRLGKSKMDVNLEKLTNIELECRDLERHLNGLKNNRVNLGDIKVIPSDFKNSVTTEEVKQVLEEKRWDIVHYAGHSFYNEQSGAYVFFKDKDDYVDPVEIKKFAEDLYKTRLLVLSSCTSAHQGFVFELVKYQIPAVLGFRTRIEDELARDFSVNFFSSLFDLRSVDKAFFQARKRLYEDDETHRAWTNPVLVLESVA